MPGASHRRPLAGNRELSEAAEAQKAEISSQVRVLMDLASKYDREPPAHVFSPPLKFAICFQLFFGGRTENEMPDSNGSWVLT